MLEREGKAGRIRSEMMGIYIRIRPIGDQKRGGVMARPRRMWNQAAVLASEGTG